MQVVVKPFRHNGRVLMPGDNLDIDAIEFAKLRALGLVGGARESAAIEPTEKATIRKPKRKKVRN